jgi:hypothetical protein
LPFGAGDHLLQAVQVLETGQQWLLESASRRETAHTLLAMGGRISSRRIALQDTSPPQDRARSHASHRHG